MKKILLSITFLIVFASVSLSTFAVNYFETIPSVVRLDVTDSNGDTWWGAGFFISSDAYILTNAHVVIDTYTGLPSEYINICTIESEYSSPKCVYSGHVLAFSEDFDLALVVPAYKINENEEEIGELIDGNTIDNTYVDFADFIPELGENLTILGFPGASLLSSITLTSGTVSGFEMDENDIIMEIATDATINPGNSGGPAYNADERVVGVVTEISVDGVGGNYGYVISNQVVYSWFLELVDSGILNSAFVDAVFSNDIIENVASEMVTDQPSDYIFTDVNVNHPYYEAINFLKNMGVVSGHPDGSFKPSDEINRAEVLKILVEGKWGTPDQEVYKNCFPDIQEEWYAKYVCFAKERGWVQGYLDNTFRPGRSVNKSEAIKMMLEVFDIEILNTETDVYEDVVVGDWFDGYIKTAKDMGILEETGVKYYPNKPILREQVSENLFRLMTFGAVG